MMVDTAFFYNVYYNDYKAAFEQNQNFIYILKNM